MAKDSYYFPHDAHARNDPKIKAMMKKYGCDGYGRFWIIIEMLREASNYSLEQNELVYSALADDCRCSVNEIEQFISDCISTYKLFTEVDGFFQSASLRRRLDKLEVIREKRSRAGVMSGEARRNREDETSTSSDKRMIPWE